MKGLLLLSGGIDSVVAGSLMKKDISLEAVHFDNRPFTGESELNKTIELCQLIGVKKLHIVKHGNYQKQVMKNCNRKFQCVMCRRMMFRVAGALGVEKGCNFLVTGENLAQVASQTLENMEVTDEVSALPILRPLLCYDKNDIIEIARKIGSYETSTGEGVCCMAVPPNPATKSKSEIIKTEEGKIDLDALVKESLENIETKEF